jgi:ribonucleoside-diphosphate reductase alpha chain
VQPRLVNLPQHVDENGSTLAKLEKTVRTAVRMLDNVIDINYYSVDTARNSNLLHRPVGLGLMGFQDALYKQRIAYGERGGRGSPTAPWRRSATSRSRPRATSPRSAALPELRGFPVEPGHPAHRLPGDPGSERGATTSRSTSHDPGLGRPARRVKTAACATPTSWPSRRRRRSPTSPASPVHRADVPEPVRQIEPVRRVHRGQSLPGHDLKAAASGTSVMVNDLKYYDGSVQADRPHPRGPRALRHGLRGRAALDRRGGSRRQKWIDQAQSLNLYINNASGKKLDITYRMAWYSRPEDDLLPALPGATGTEKSTIDTGKLNAVSAAPGAGAGPGARCRRPVRWTTRTARPASKAERGRPGQCPSRRQKAATGRNGIHKQGERHPC